MRQIVSQKINLTRIYVPEVIKDQINLWKKAANLKITVKAARQGRIRRLLHTRTACHSLAWGEVRRTVYIGPQMRPICFAGILLAWSFAGNAWEGPKLAAGQRPNSWDRRRLHWPCRI